MKQIQQYIKESILDDEDDVIQNDDFLIEKWLKDNYIIAGKYVINRKIINVNGGIYVNNYSIQQLLPEEYSFGEIIGGMFSCNNCAELKSLEGSPRKVSGDFACDRCYRLENLYGAPKEVGGNFYCAACDKLKNLKGAPEIVKGNFDCYGCDQLISLEGAPKIVKRNFTCYDCPKLKSLKYLPKSIGGSLLCFNCGNLFDVNDILNISNIKGRIVVK